MAAKSVLLLSGGIDSPVAGHRVAERGVEVVPLHFSLEPFTDAAPEEKSRRIVDLLELPPLHVCRIGEALAEIARSCRHRYYFVLSKRLMLRLAGSLAREVGARALITGESLGQVSSQTLWNLRAIDAATDLPVLRPLIGWDKVEITAAAQAIGTYEVSKGPEVCDVLGPSHPATRAKLDIVEAEEARLPYPELLAASLKTLRPTGLRPASAGQA